jgi:hypothetical protein
MRRAGEWQRTNNKDGNLSLYISSPATGMRNTRLVPEKIQQQDSQNVVHKTKHHVGLSSNFKWEAFSDGNRQ